MFRFTSVLFLLTALVILAGPVLAEETKTGVVPPPAVAVKPEEMSVDKAVSQPAPAETPVSAAPPAESAPKDPCEAYKARYETYVVCQDRMMKIQRMIDARDQRYKARTPAPPPAPATPAPVPAAPPAPAATTPAPVAPEASQAPAPAAGEEKKKAFVTVH